MNLPDDKSPSLFFLPPELVFRPVFNALDIAPVQPYNQSADDRRAASGKHDVAPSHKMKVQKCNGGIRRRAADAARETILLHRNTIKNTANKGKISTGLMAMIVPVATDTALPPLKPKYTGYTCPRTAQNAAI